MRKPPHIPLVVLEAAPVRVDTCWSNTLVLPSVCCPLSYLPCEISARFRRGHSTAEELDQMCNRGNAAVFAVVCALGASSDVARGQDFPNRPITFVVPYAVGGTVDVQLRALAGTTEKHLGRR